MAGELIPFPGASHTPAGDELAPEDSRAGEPGEQVVESSAAALPATATSPAPPSRGYRVLRWLRWHRLELTSVGLPLGIAALHGWLWTIPAALAALGWAAHEIHQRRKEVSDDAD